MATSPGLGDSVSADSTLPIYEPSRTQASDSRRALSHRELILTGAVAGGALWLLLDLLGVPNVFGLGSEAGLIPLIVVGALLALTRFRLVVPSISLMLICVVMIVAYTPVIVGPARTFIRADPLPSSADAVVVLSAGVTPDGFLTQQGTDRALKGVQLVESGLAPVIVFTLEEKRTGGKRYNSVGDQKRISAIARISNVLFTRRVKSTHDEAVAVAAIARERGWRRIALVTSPFHTRRACATFEKTGLIVSCVPSESRDIAVRRLIYPHDRVAAFGMWLYETAGTLRYRQLGWI
jgi:uncharacterized SAM-binding protein YcdF (DUF218 family)